MAKYTYEYACGHGTEEIQLFGKNAERQRKLEWYSQTRVCKECYKKQMAEADVKAEPTVEVHHSLMAGEGVLVLTRLHCLN